MLNRLADQVGDILVFAGAALIFGIVRLLLLPGPHPVKVYLTSLAASVPVGTIIGALCLEYGMADIASIAATSVASLVAHDLLRGIMNNREFLGELLKQMAKNMADKVSK